jgi:hypothetical protein
MTVIEYMNRFEELKIRCRGREDPRHSLSRFKQGLRPEIRNQMMTYPVNSIDEAFQFAQRIERSSKQTVRRFPSQAEEIITVRRFPPNGRGTKLVATSSYNMPNNNRSKVPIAETRRQVFSNECFNCG